MNADRFETALKDGAQLLARTRPLWHPRPFTFERPPWATSYPELAAYCEQLSEAELFALEQLGPLPTSAPECLRALEAELHPLQAPFQWKSAGPLVDIDEARFGRVSWRVPARKLSQIKAIVGFSSAYVPAPHAVFDWCGGKGHLGRTIGAYLQAPVTVLELEPSYEAEALSLAERLKVTLSYVPTDALSEEGRASLRGQATGTLALGLHACGVLGETLVHEVVRHQGLSLAHAPCCLHKVVGGYRALSQAGEAALVEAGLVLDHSALRLATSDEVLARPALRQGRRRENAWRLALDLLLQEASGQAHYQPLGVLPAEWLRLDFAQFAQLAAAHRGLSLPESFDPQAAVMAGEKRAALARRYGIVRGRFRRVLELQVVLDRAQALVEAGLEVTVQPFCEPHLSPRNLLILARPKGL